MVKNVGFQNKMNINKKKIIRILQLMLVIGFLLGLITGYYYSSFKSELNCYDYCVEKLKDSNCFIFNYSSNYDNITFNNFSYSLNYDNFTS